jgi:hypothetical protein
VQDNTIPGTIFTGNTIIGFAKSIEVGTTTDITNGYGYGSIVTDNIYDGTITDNSSGIPKGGEPASRLAFRRFPSPMTPLTRGKVRFLPRVYVRTPNPGSILEKSDGLSLFVSGGTHSLG